MEVDLDHPAAARQAGLTYVRDDAPGIRRRPAGTGFDYTWPDGRQVRDEDTLSRIRALAVPPAWTGVWISPDPQGHLQATGRDARGRKQYRYHPRWHAVRDETKFGRMVAFGEALPRLRERVDADLRRRGLPRERVVAAVVRLLERGLIRVGNAEYARDNESYGATTLRDDHVEIDNATLTFEFRAKSGKIQTLRLRDPRLARIVGRVRDLPGQELFQYLDEAGERRTVGSADVNEYLRGVMGEAFTAKDFRTWAATVLAAGDLCGDHPPETRTEARKRVRRTVDAVAARLGNTPAVCRRSYIHPEVLDAFADGRLAGLLDACPAQPRPGLSRDETAVLAFLRNLA